MPLHLVPEDDEASEFADAVVEQWRAQEMAARDKLPPAIRAAVATCAVAVSCVRLLELLEAGLVSEASILAEFLTRASMATKH